MSLLIFALALDLASPPQTAPVEQAVARAIAVSLPESQYDWAMDWGPYGVRLGREARWHLSEPLADDEDDLPDGVYRRVGWISRDGAASGVTACGDATRVHALIVSVSSLSLGRGDIAAELAALGVNATETSRTEAIMPQGADDYDRALRLREPARIVWTLKKPGHDEATLTADYRCTRPGMRSAPRCRTHFTVNYRPADREPMPCDPPGRSDP